MNLVAYNVLPTWKKLHLFNIHSYHYEKNPKHRLREDGKGKGRREEGVRTEDARAKVRCVGWGRMLQEEGCKIKFQERRRQRTDNNHQKKRHRPRQTTKNPEGK